MTNRTWGPKGSVTHPRKTTRSQPEQAFILHARHLTWQLREPAVEILLDGWLQGTLIALVERLRLKRVAIDLVGEQVAAAVSVHGSLQGVALPAKDVVAVNAVTRRVSKGPDEWLAAVIGP